MPPHCQFSLVGGQHFRTRAIGFLFDIEQRELDAKDVYDTLPLAKEQIVNARFKHWLDRAVFDKYFHGFTGKYDRCFVFKWELRHIPQRLYGFLCHPRPDTMPFFELCVLMYFATKGEDTNPTILDRINRLRQDPAVREAIAGTYPEFSGRKKPWTN